MPEILRPTRRMNRMVYPRAGKFGKETELICKDFITTCWSDGTPILELI